MKPPANPIRLFATICVALTSVFVAYMAFWMNDVLAGPGWCRTALGAEKASGGDGTIKGLDACVGLLTIQLKSLAFNATMSLGVIALCLLVLIVIVIAGARLDLKASMNSLEASMTRDAPAAAAKVAADGKAALDQSVEDVKDAVK